MVPVFRMIVQGQWCLLYQKMSEKPDRGDYGLKCPDAKQKGRAFSGPALFFLREIDAAACHAAGFSLPAFVPAIRPKTTQSVVAFPPRRFDPWTPPQTSPAA